MVVSNGVERGMRVRPRAEMGRVWLANRAVGFTYYVINLVVIITYFVVRNISKSLFILL